MRNILSTLVLITLIGTLSHGQSRKKYGEFGAALGTLNLSSDISNSGSVNAIFQEMRPGISIFGKQHYNDWFALGIDMGYGFLYANDRNHTNDSRGLTVETQIFNANLFTEIHLIRFGKFRQDRPFSIFIKGGVGIVGYNPELSIAGQLPGNIELETDAYSALNLITAAGVKFRISYKSILTIEARSNTVSGDEMDGFLFTDNTPAGNDSFWGLQIGYSLMIF